MKSLIRTLIKVFCLLVCISCTTVTIAQNRSFVAGTDTIDVYPFVPTVFNILANDTIRAGDTIYRVFGGGTDYVALQNDSNHVFTFTGSRWGSPDIDTGTYRIVLTNGDYTFGTIIYRIHDHSYDYLDINNVSAVFYAFGNHFFRENAAFEVPKGSGKTSVFSNAFWVGGKDGQGNLHFAGERYRQGPTTGPAGTKPDFYGGPIMDSVNYSIYQDTAWNYIWNLKKTEVGYHAAHYLDPGYVPIHDILTWPGNGNTALGQAHKLAPFYDRNADGIYDPFDGDTPEIRGDQELYFIFNDDRGPHLESQGEKLRIEIRGMAYAFDMPEDSALKNTVFLHYQVFNRSQNTYDSTYFGAFTDIDLGYAMDDYLGCDVERNLYFGYNGTPVDGTGQSYAYGEHPPTQGVVILGGPLLDNDDIDNPRFDNQGHQICDYSVNGINFGDSIVDNERYGMTRFVYFNNSGVPQYMSDPAYAMDYYHYMQGLWKDGSPVIYGGNGNPAAGGYGPGCRFMFPGESDTLNWGTGCVPPNGQVNWTESTAGNVPGDRRGVGVSGPFTFKPGDEQDIDIAFVWARDYTSKSPQASLDKLRQIVDKVNTAFVTNKLPNGQPFYGIGDKVQPEGVGVNIYPNPASDQITVEFSSGNHSGPATVYLLNNQGRHLKSFVIPENSLKSRMDVSDIPAGFYLLRIVTGENVVTTKVVVGR
ncbi:MAG: T9SS type A sorting domain-containing protein [Bacteroidetes bacterium]|nr:T9SS type A sorting domain-containing protein [Bacteroidota bacterium]